VGKRYFEGIGWVEEQSKDEWRNGIHIEEKDYALRALSKWHNLPPYIIDKALHNVESGLNECPECGERLHSTNIERKAPRDATNIPYSFPNGRYKCKKCAE